jgi:hypothetical protein
VWKSTDGGTSWSVTTSRAGASETEAIVISPSHPNVVYMGAWSNNDDGIRCGTYVTEDGGGSWWLRRTTEYGVGSAGIMSIAIHPTNPSIAIAGTLDGGIQYTQNMGLTWAFALSTLGQFRHVEFDTQIPDRAYGISTRYGVGTNRGLYVSNTKGTMWSRDVAFPPHLNILKTFANVRINGRLVTYIGTRGSGVVSNRFDPQSAQTSADPSPESIPQKIRLEEPFPNPFNPSTVITYEIAGVRNQHSMVSVRVFDIHGREVAILVNAEKSAGRYTVVWDAADVSSGVYFCRLTAGTFTQTRKLLLLR